MIANEKQWLRRSRTPTYIPKSSGCGRILSSGILWANSIIAAYIQQSPITDGSEDFLPNAPIITTITSSGAGNAFVNSFVNARSSFGVKPDNVI